MDWEDHLKTVLSSSKILKFKSAMPYYMLIFASSSGL